MPLYVRRSGYWSAAFIAVVPVALDFILISADPPTVLFALSAGYVFLGFALWRLLWRLRGNRLPNSWPDTSGIQIGL